MKTKMIEIKVPSTMSDEGIKVKKWHVRDNENVAANSPLVEMESGNFYLEMNADYAGKVKIFLKEGDKGKTNDILCTITY